MTSKASRVPSGELEHAQGVPGSFAAHVADVAARFDVPRAALLSEIGVTPEALDDPGARIPLQDFIYLMDRACRVTAEPGFGVYLGLHGRISAHGYLGFAAMTARSLREAIELAVRFLPTQTTSLGLRLEVRGMEASVVVEERAAFGTAREAIVLATCIGVWRMGNAITGRELVGTADFAFEKPSYLERLESIVAPPGRVRYGQAEHRLVFSVDQLNLPLALSDSAAMRLAREQCERELDALSAGRTLASRVAGRIIDSAGDVRPLEAIARELALSTRTLKRKLADEGVSYTALLDERRRLQGCSLLRTELSVEQIAERLGYSDAANFTRAFRRWTGKTPREFRS
jgi:AraC-like DNA-binding protein